MHSISASPTGPTRSTYRIDLPCEQAGFGTPPFDVHLKVLPGPAGQGWTVLALSAPGKPDLLARWLAQHAPIREVRVAPGLAPKLFRAKVEVLPPAWATVAACVKVHHLDLGADGHAAWFVEATRDQAGSLVHDLKATQRTPRGRRPDGVRCRRVMGEGGAAAISRRQFEALSTAVAMGYYEIPHRIDLRTLAASTGVSLGSVSELLRRAEAAILTHYVDSSLMGWPPADEDELRAFQPLATMSRP